MFSHKELLTARKKRKKKERTKDDDFFFRHGELNPGLVGSSEVPSVRATNPSH